MFKILKPITCAAALCVASALPVGAETGAKIIEAGFVEDVGASERINYSGKLRMLSQRIAAASCYAAKGVALPASRDQLAAAIAEFDLILNGLEFGEASLNMIGVEKNRRVLARLKDVHAVWNPMKAAVTKAVDAGDYAAAVEVTSHENGPLLEAAKLLVSELVGEYSDPTALLQADAITIDIAGRQRMLAQRISKNACFISAGLNGESAAKELAGARSMYDASVNALRFGMPNAGIIATTNPEILANLDDVLGLWADIQPVLDHLVAGDDVSEDQKAYLFASSNALTGKMNTVVGQYNVDSKLGL